MSKRLFLIPLFVLLMVQGANAEPAPLQITGEIAPKIVTIDRPVLETYRQGGISHITFHHEGFAGNDAALFAKASKARLRQSVEERLLNINAYHAKRAGLGMIAYHYAIGPDGQIAKGRPVAYAPATKSTRIGSSELADFTGHFAVVALGDFNHEHLTGAAWLSYIRVMSEAQRAYRVPSANIAPHKRHASTSCPGKNILARESEIRQAVMIHSLQAELKARRCGRVQVDGVWGHRTAEAFKAFHEANAGAYRARQVSDAALMEMLDKPDLRCR